MTFSTCRVGVWPMANYLSGRIEPETSAFGSLKFRRSPAIRRRPRPPRPRRVKGGLKRGIGSGRVASRRTSVTTHSTSRITDDNTCVGGSRLGKAFNTLN